jgi:hypothetical protein
MWARQYNPKRAFSGNAKKYCTASLYNSARELGNPQENDEGNYVFVEWISSERTREVVPGPTVSLLPPASDHQGSVYVARASAPPRRVFPAM